MILKYPKFMARTISEIEKGILDGIAADVVLSPLSTSTSKMSVWRLLARIVATSIWTVEVLFDTLKAEVNEIIATLKPHTARWYANKAKAFQYGFTLGVDSDTYDNTGFTEEQIEDSLIIKYSAVTEQNDGKLRIKVATEATDLEPLSVPQKAAFTEYMKRVKDAGVKMVIDSLAADKLKLTLKIYYDPLILNVDGQRIDGADSEPVQKAVKYFLKNQPFNGVFVLAYLVDALQKVEGVVIPHIVNCLTQYGAFPFVSVDVQYLPDAGYMRIESDSDLVIEFIAQSQLK
jgi:hypothetical protein